MENKLENTQNMIPLASSLKYAQLDCIWLGDTLMNVVNFLEGKQRNDEFRKTVL